MTGEELLDAMEHIDPELIEAADTPVKKRKTPRWIVAIAAILVLAISVSMLLKNGLTDPKPTTQPLMDYTITAQMLADMIPASATDSAVTKNYKLYWGLTLEDLKIQPVQHKDSLIIYSLNTPTVDETLFCSYIDSYLPKLAGLLGISTPQYALSEYLTYDLYATASSPEMPDLEISAKYSDASITERNLFEFSAKNFMINGSRISIHADDSDATIREKLADTIASINLNFQTNYDSILIDRFQGLPRIYLYHAETDTLPADSVHSNGIPASEYILLYFSQDIRGEDDILYLSYFEITKMIVPIQDYYIPLGKARMLTVEEAEVLLSKGYIFSGSHICPKCAKNYSEVNFLEYDAVKLVYIRGKGGIAVPFYEFYKVLDTRGVAAVYVPAVEVDGLEEYFANQIKEHE